MRPIPERTTDIAMSAPARLIARGANALGRPGVADRLRRRTSWVPAVALVVTTLAWLLVVFRGVLYPIGASNLEASWGGPTLVGAWAAHLAIAVGILVVVSFLLALVTGRSDPAHR